MNTHFFNPKTRKTLFLVFITSFFLGCKTNKNISSQTDKNLKVYTDFLEKQNTSAKDYVLNLFDSYDIVILCERDHREITQYDLILEILKDKRFTRNIQNAYFEVGNSKYNDELNNFLHNSSLTDNEVAKTALQMQRNMFPLWEKANYAYYLKNVHKINSKLADNKVNIYNLDLGIRWEDSEKEKNHQKELNGADRDSTMAVNFIEYHKQSKTKKALVVLNFRHAFLQDMLGRKNAGRFIADEFKGKVANVYINSIIFKSSKVTDRDVSQTAIGTQQNGKREASFIKSGKKDVAFDLVGTPFGNDPFDMLPFPNEMKYSDVFTGFIHYNYFPDFCVVSGIENFIDDKYYEELIKRYQFFNEKIPSKNELIETFNTVTKATYREEFPDVVREIEEWLDKGSNK